VLQAQGENTKIRAHALTGWVPRDAIGNDGLLELYVIDVGQGDGVLMRTPDDKWHLIETGIENEQQMRKTAGPSGSRRPLVGLQ